MDLLSALPISLRQLQYIVAVAEFGSFRRAAEACHVAQPPPSPLVAQARRILVAAGDCAIWPGSTQAKDGTIDGAVLALEADLGGLVHAPLGRDPFLLAVERAA
jgi:DNA-binding transcriptional LysR family regulator